MTSTVSSKELKIILITINTNYYKNSFVILVFNNHCDCVVPVDMAKESRPKYKWVSKSIPKYKRASKVDGDDNRCVILNLK